MFDVLISQAATRDLFDYVDIFMPVIVGVIALIFAHLANKINKDAIKQQHEEFEAQLHLQKEQFNAQMKSQLDQWKYDAVVRSEIETVAHMRILFFEARESIHFFMWNFLSPFSGYKHYFHNTVDAPYKRRTFIKHWKKLQSINIHLNRNLIIFQKYNLASKIQFVQPILALNYYLAENDFEKVFDNENSNNILKDSRLDPSKFYKLKDEDKFKNTFASEANQRLIKLALADYQDIPQEEQMIKYSVIWHKVLNIFENIETDINRVLFDYDGLIIPESEKIGTHSYFLNLENNTTT